MRRIGILYFSAVGGTKVIAELLAELLEQKGTGPGALGAAHAVSLVSIEDEGAAVIASEADFIVFCYPTYYLKPAPPMRTFASSLRRQGRVRPCYLITTCELYSENSVRHLARILAGNGLAVHGWKALRAPGSDVTAVLDARLVPWLYRFGSGMEKRLKAAAEEIAGVAIEDGEDASLKRLPPPRWYTPLTQLFQVVALNHFDVVKHRFKSLGERCTRCGLCAEACPSGAIQLANEGVRFDTGMCILCCRCLHGCPAKAIVLDERLKDNRRIDPSLLARLKDEARAGLGLGARTKSGEPVQRKDLT